MKGNLFAILDQLGISYSHKGRASAIFDDVEPVQLATDSCLSFIDKSKTNKESLVRHTKSKVLIIDCSLKDITFDLEAKLLVFVDNPKLVFVKVLNAIQGCDMEFGVHPSAVVDGSAIIAENVLIGANVVIGKNCSVGSNSIIKSNTVIYSNTEIGSNVEIESNATLGMPGFGFIDNGEGGHINFPHIGGVTIEDNVVIGSSTCIARGGLSDTIIRQGVKIDNLVHIAHNVIIGENCMITAQVMIAGSVTIGRDTWVGPGSIIRDNISIGSDCFISIGSTVVRDVVDNDHVTGYFAQTHKHFLKRYLGLFKL